MNCCIHAGFHIFASSGFDHDFGFRGAEKRSGGEAANGTPRNLLTVVEEEGNDVVVPTITPASIVAVGEPADIGVARAKRAAALILTKEKCMMGA